MHVSKKKLLIVGAFPQHNNIVYGGQLTACRKLINSSLPNKLILTLVDSTQKSNPAPIFFIRLFLGIKRFFNFIIKFELNKPDRILIFTGSGIGLFEKGLMSWYAKSRNTNSYIFPRGGKLLNMYSKKNILPNWIKFSLKPAKKILCQGSKWQDLIINGLNRGSEDAPIIANWSASEELLNVGKDRVYVKKRKYKIIFVGWVIKEKGIKELLNSILLIKESNNFCLDIIGGGAFLEEAKKIVKEKKINKFVTFYGWRSPDFVKVKLSEADIFVLPSWEEGFPNALVEALAMGLCIITTNVGTISDYISNYKNGIYLEPKNDYLLANTLKRVLNDFNLMSSLSKAGYLLAKKKFSTEIAINKIIKAVDL